VNSRLMTVYSTMFSALIASALWVLLLPCQAQNTGLRREFPDARAKVLVFADQLPSQITDARRRFIATHDAGSQKQSREWIRRVRQINPAYLLLHYQLAVGAGPALFVEGDSWTRRQR
jgi:hypothetical protein